MARGRPRKKIDGKMVHDLAMIGCSVRLIGERLGISHDVVERRYKAQVVEGRSNGEVRILAKIFQSALAGHSKAMELVAVNRLHWRSKPEVNIAVAQFCGAMSPTELKGNLTELRQAVADEALRQSGAVTRVEMEVFRDGTSANGQPNGQAPHPRLPPT